MNCEQCDSHLCVEKYIVSIVPAVYGQSKIVHTYSVSTHVNGMLFCQMFKLWCHMASNQIVTVAPPGVFQVDCRSRELDVAIQQAQTRETQMVEMSHWMTQVTSLLQHRLDADILAGDMPKEYEVRGDWVT